MTWERIHKTAGLLTAVFLPLWWLNFVVYFFVSLCIGGNYFYGRVEGDQYFLALGGNHQRHPLTQVSKEVYSYSVYHHGSIIALAFIFGPAMVVWVIAGSICRRREQPREIRITPSGIMLDGEAVSITSVVEMLQAAARCDRDHRPKICVKNDYEAQDAPAHAVAFQLALIEHNLLVEQEPPRGKDRSPTEPL
jgi:hypothetical protein